MQDWNVFQTIHFHYYRVIVQVEGISSHHKFLKLSCKVKVAVGGLMFGPPPLINFIRKFIKLPDNLLKVLHTDISDGITLLFVFLWNCFGLDTQRCNQPLYWYSQIIFWLWICDSHLVQTAKLQRYVQNDVIITTLDISVFPNISTTTIFILTAVNSPRVKFFSPINFYPQNVFQVGQPW